MNPLSDNHTTEPRELGSPSANFNGINFGHPVSIHGEVEAKHRILLVQWLNSLLPLLNLSINTTDDELRACLSNGTVLCQILNRLRPGSVNMVSDSDHSLPSHSENVKRFLTALDGLGLPKFEISDLEKGHMKPVVDCLLTLRARSSQNTLGDNISVTNSKVVNPRGHASSNVHYSLSSGGDHRKVSSESKFQRVLRSRIMAEPSAALIHHVGHKFHEVFQLKHGSYVDLPAAKISEMMKSNSLDNAPTQSLLSVVNGILEESVERRNGEIPHRVACLLRKVVQEIERRISTQADHLRTQNNLFKSREEKYQSRIKVLEALASGTKEESEIVTSQPQQLKTEKTKEDEKKADDIEVIRLMKEQEDKNMEISTLKQELETMKKTYERQCSQLEAEAKSAKGELKQKMKEQEDKNMQISILKQELETIKKTYEGQWSQVEAEAKGAKVELKEKMKEQEDKDMEISKLKQELKTMKKTYEAQCLQLEAEAKGAKGDFKQKMKEHEDKNMEILTLKQELETMKKTYEGRWSQLESEAKGAKGELKDKMKEQENKNMEISKLKEELETIKKTYEGQCSQLEVEAKGAKEELKQKMKEQKDKNMEISKLKQELETIKKTYEGRCSQLEVEAKGAKEELKQKMKEQEDKNMEISKLKEELETIKKTYEGQRSQLEAEAKGAKGELKQKMEEQEDKNMEISKLKQELETIKKTYEGQHSQLEAEAKGAKGELKQKMEEQEDKNMEISKLKQELETIKKTYEGQCSQLEAEAKGAKGELKQKMKEQEDKNMEISTLKQELETMKKTYEGQCSQLEAEVKGAKGELKQKMKEQEDKNMDISTLKQELETTKKAYEGQCSQLEAEAKGAKEEVKQKSQEYENQLEKLRNKFKENEAIYESKYQKWNMKEIQLHDALKFQLSFVQNLKLSWESIKQDVMKEQTIYAEECDRLGVNLKVLVDAAENYQVVLAENRKLFNEVQELKGNIRVYCRIRPFLPGQKEKQSIIEHVGENDLVVANPSKQGKDALRSFKFNKVFSSASTQVEVYSDIQCFIRSVLDGYNVCIFAYGQTGSGKTFTMSGPNGATSETVGVNYRALNDLFSISTSRKSTIVYEIGVQIIEIYNEQVRDLLSADGSSKKLGILSHSQPKGLAVPDASMFPVKSTSDVMKLMDTGFKNRAMGSTAMNERSSRSHSVVSIHVRGTDVKSGSTQHGNLHLVDLAGSERIDRSEVTGDRLKEAQHINKSLSALGDVIFALSQKNAHVPYRNSKLTQLLQTALGGHAKTLMLVQINPDVKSFSETLSTLKFAERVSGVELGAAKSSKDGRDVKELMEQVASLKDTILKKDDEIERLQLLKDLKNVYPGADSEKRGTASVRD